MQKIQFYGLNVIGSILTIYGLYTAVTCVVDYTALPIMVFGLVMLAINNNIV